MQKRDICEILDQSMNNTKSTNKLKKGTQLNDESTNYLHINQIEKKYTVQTNKPTNKDHENAIRKIFVPQLADKRDSEKVLKHKKLNKLIHVISSP